MPVLPLVANGTSLFRSSQIAGSTTRTCTPVQHVQMRTHTPPRCAHPPVASTAARNNSGHQYDNCTFVAVRAVMPVAPVRPPPQGAGALAATPGGTPTTVGTLRPRSLSPQVV